MRQFAVISSRSMVRFQGVFRLCFNPVGFCFLLAFVVFGHLLAFGGWELLLFSWDPSRVSAFSGLTYLIFLLASAVSHELGHLVVALYRGDLIAGMYVQFNSWQPAFLVKRQRDKDNTVANPVYNLAGILAQLLFAASLGVLFFLTGYYALPASVVLIDLGAFMSLVLLPGSDGQRFLTDVLRHRSSGTDAGRENQKGPVVALIRYTPIFIMVLFVFLFLIASLILLIGISYQWSSGALKGLTWGDSVPGYVLQYIIVIAPALMYFVSGLGSMSMVFDPLKRYLFRSPEKETWR